jgi:prevent-host-death family protein
MKRASISETKNSLSALIDEVKQGEEILITDRGKPVARLIAAVSEHDAPGRLQRLERKGLVVRGRMPVDMDSILAPPPRPPRGKSLLEMVLHERETGR